MQAQKPTDQELIAIAKDAIAKFKTIMAHPKWEKIADTPCLMFRMEIEGTMAAKGETKVAFSADKVYAFLMKSDSLKKLNPQLKEQSDLHVIKGEYETTVDRSRYSAPWPVSDREFINVGTSCKEGDTYFIATQGCEYPYPEDKSVVRGKVLVGGYMIKATG